MTERSRPDTVRRDDGRICSKGGGHSKGNSEERRNSVRQDKKSADDEALRTIRRKLVERITTETLAGQADGTIGIRRHLALSVRHRRYAPIVANC
jgi:hypothetical protein